MKSQLFNRNFRHRFKDNFNIALHVPIKLDVHVVEHCNLNCKGCTHFSPVAQPKFLDPSEFEKNLKTLSRNKRFISTFQLLGGEPLLHPQLSQLIDISRKYLPDSNITVMTNGILLAQEDKLPMDFWESCRRNDIMIKVTKYPIDLDYDKIMTICDNQGVKNQIFKDKSQKNERWPGWRFFPLYKEGYYNFYKKIRILKVAYCGSLNCFQLVGNKIYPCAHMAYISHLNKAFNQNFKISKRDYIEIEHLKYESQLRKLMLLSTSFCRYCGNGYLDSYWEISKKKEEEWIK